MDVVVIGGGFGGLASAARLAKLGHAVTLLEARDRLGGALGTIEQDGFAWDTGPAYTLLPAVIRDLFRKSGRPLERELDLVHLDPAATHIFPNSKTETVQVDWPAGSRGAQIEALTGALGADAATQWTAYVDGFADVWEVLRKDWLERPYAEAQASKAARDILGSRLTLHKHTDKALKDPRLRLLARHRFTIDGQAPRDVPWWLGMWHYVEQNFGVWTAPSGLGQLSDVLTARLQTRGVTVHTCTPARDLVMRQDRVAGVRTDDGVIDADRVVVAIDPRRVPALASYVVRTMPAIPPVVCHVGLVGEVPEVAPEVIIHEDVTLVVRPGGRAPAGAHAWTLIGRGSLSEDIVTAVHRAGLRIADQVEARIDRTPRATVEELGSSPVGVRWQGRGTLKHLLGPDTPLAGVHLAGAHAATGSGLPAVGLSASLVAQRIGPA